MNITLATTLKGQFHNLELKNPVIAASGTFGSGLEFSPFGDIASLGGISVKGISLQPRQGNPSPRIVETAAGMLNAIGLQNDGVDHFLKYVLPQLPWQKTAVIANIYGASVEEFAQLAERLDSAEGIAALEVNVSCPNVKAGGSFFGSSPQMCFQVIAETRRHAPSKHIIAKLSPNVTDIALIARSAEDAGADSISAINTLLGMAVDVASRKPCLANITGGLSGPAIKPVALRCVWQISKAVGIPVIGLGGICNARDALEFLLVGASAVQIGTANFMNPAISFSIVSALPEALRAQGADSPAALTGALIVDQAWI